MSPFRAIAFSQIMLCWLKECRSGIVRHAELVMERRSQPYIELLFGSLFRSHGFLLFDIHASWPCAADALISLTTSKVCSEKLWELQITRACIAKCHTHRALRTSGSRGLTAWSFKGCIDDFSMGKREIAMVYKRMIQESKNNQRYQAITRET